MTFLLQTLLDGLSLGGMYALVAIGLTLFFGVMGIFNLAHGEFVVLAVLLSWVAGRWWGTDPLVTIVPIVIIIGLLGVAMYRYAYAPVMSKSILFQIIVALGVSIVLQNLMALFIGADFRSLTPPYANIVVKMGSISTNLMSLVALALGVVGSLAVMWMLRLTNFGRNVRAVSQDAELAALTGIRVRRTFYYVAFIASVLAAVAGLMIGLTSTVSPFSGLSFTLKSSAIIVLGGLGNVRGAFVGAFILGLFEVFVSSYVPSGTAWSEGVAFVLIIGVLLIKPKGLLGSH